MKKQLLILALMVTSKCYSQQIQFDHEEFNFTTIKQGENLTHEFKFTNNSDYPLTLTSVTPSCGCITTQWPQKPVMKGQTASITAVFNTTGKMGKQDKTLTVMSNSSNNKVSVLHIKGEIILTETISNSSLIDTNKSSVNIAKSDSKLETNAPKQIKLPVFNDIIDITSMMGKTNWSLGVHFQKAEYAPVKPAVVINDINEFVNNGKSGHELEKLLLKKYKGSIDSTFGNMSLIGSSLGSFVYLRNSEIPIRFCSYKEVSKLCFITGIALDNVYNTLRLTSRQRARKVLTESLLPSLKNFKPMLNKEFDYIGLGAIYGCKDFSDDYASTREEYLAIVVSCKKVKDYIAGNITEDELVESADIISVDSEMVTGTKRIKITLE